MEEVAHVVVATDAPVTVSGEPKIGDQVARDQGAFIEVLDKHDTVLHRIRYDRLPITIGNTYRCDHVLDSDDTRAQTVLLAHDESGALSVQSTDHARFWAPGGLTHRWSVNPDQAFVVAGERLRVRTRDYLATRSTAPSAIGWLGGWMTLAAVAAALAVTALQGWLADIDGDRLSGYVTGALGMVGVVSLWSSVWAIVSRLNGKSSHFLAHLSLASLAVVAIAAVDFVFDSAAFSLNLPWLQRYGYLLLALSLAVLVWCHTRYIVRARLGSALTAAFAVGLTVFVLQATTYYNLRGNLSSSLTMTEMRPPGWRITNGASLDAFFANGASLEKRAEDSKPEKPDGLDLGMFSDE